MTLRMLAAALAALAIAVPAASAAVPAPDLQTPVQTQTQTQDLRSPDARDAAAAVRQDLRSPDARDAALRPSGQPAGHVAVPAADTVPESSGSAGASKRRSRGSRQSR
jgi:hypothetical protein